MNTTRTVAIALGLVTGLGGCVELGSAFTLSSGVGAALSGVAAVQHHDGAGRSALLMAFEGGGDYQLGLRSVDLFHSGLSDTLPLGVRPVGATAHPFEDDLFLVATEDSVVGVSFYDYGEPRFRGVEFDYELSGGAWEIQRVCDVDAVPTDSDGEQVYLTAETDRGLALLVGTLLHADRQVSVESGVVIASDGGCGRVAVDPTDGTIYVSDRGRIHEVTPALSPSSSADSGGASVDIEANRGVLASSVQYSASGFSYSLLGLSYAGTSRDAVFSDAVALTSRKHGPDGDDDTLYAVLSDGDVRFITVQED